STEYSVSLLYSLDEDFVEAALGSMTTDATGAGTVAFASKESGSHVWKITVTKANTDVTTTISLGSVAFDPAKVYNVYRHWNIAGTYEGFSKTIDLSWLCNDVTVRNGMTLTDELDDHDLPNVSIAAGATVTLSDARIDMRYPSYSSTLCAGLTCLGDATIVLADGTTNLVMINGIYPAIQAGPPGTTLTIRGGTAGTGSLTAESHADADGNSGAAGIGGGRNMSVGNIRIEGGQITAIGGDWGAGIGCGEKVDASASASCGHITITGGEVTATGGSHGAGIGSGEKSECGNISISGGTVNVMGGHEGAGIGSGGNGGICGYIRISGGKITAQGEGGAAGIGSGKHGSCGDITITGGTGTATGGSDSPKDIGAGDYGSCGTVSVADGTIIPSSIKYACTLTLSYSYTAGNMGEPIYNVSASQIRVSVGGKTYYAEGSSFTNGQTITVNLPAGSDLTLTVTSPSTSYQQVNSELSGFPSTTYTHDFVGTLTNVTITPGGTNNLGTVNLVRQLP
ncbi:MAG: hypothetical protein IK075_00255, partial [Prevotella sp.]|nr:hypothetical protein [Prevotella sp.]